MLRNLDGMAHLRKLYDGDEGEFVSVVSAGTGREDECGVGGEGLRVGRGCASVEATPGVWNGNSGAGLPSSLPIQERLRTVAVEMHVRAKGLKASSNQ
jgi:hypothetical protein